MAHYKRRGPASLHFMTHFSFCVYKRLFNLRLARQSSALLDLSRGLKAAELELHAVSQLKTLNNKSAEPKNLQRFMFGS